MAVARRLLSLGVEQRGATVEMVFNTDEEIGLVSAHKLDFLPKSFSTLSLSRLAWRKGPYQLRMGG